MKPEDVVVNLSAERLRRIGARLRDESPDVDAAALGTMAQIGALMGRTTALLDAFGREVAAHAARLEEARAELAARAGLDEAEPQDPKGQPRRRLVCQFCGDPLVDHPISSTRCFDLNQNVRRPG